MMNCQQYYVVIFLFDVKTRSTAWKTRLRRGWYAELGFPPIGRSFGTRCDCRVGLGRAIKR